MSEFYSMWMVYRLGAIAILIILLFLFFAEKTGRRYPIGYVLIVAIIGFILIVGVLAE
jgi:RsiW-degrading membrane proteinase PrsW (M82 family)